MYNIGKFTRSHFESESCIEKLKAHELTEIDLHQKTKYNIN